VVLRVKKEGGLFLVDLSWLVVSCMRRGAIIELGGFSIVGTDCRDKNHITRPIFPQFMWQTEHICIVACTLVFPAPTVILLIIFREVFHCTWLL
jgi:hypothetical protein